MFVDPDGKDFRIKERARSITISAVIYTNKDSAQSVVSANQAAEFWNSRTSDRYYGKTIKYDIKVYSKPEYEFKDMRDGSALMMVSPKINKYEVNDQKLLECSNLDDATGCYSHKTGNIFIRSDYSQYKPDSKSKSSTGAHEIGHILGMKHEATGIMTERQDENRTDDVLESNIKQMMSSSKGERFII